jgi:glycosyltransferase involved in cell wall biosynthesis
VLPSLALFAPLPPEKTGIAEYTEALLPHIANAYRVTVITSGRYRPARRTLDTCRPYSGFETGRTHYDMLAYQLGNSQAHDYMFGALHRYPGVVLLHDLVLYHGILYDCLNRNRASEFSEEMQYSYGYQGRAAAERILAGRKDESAQYPLIERVLDDALAAVVFNSYMVERISETNPGVECTWIPLHTVSPPGFPEDFDARAFRASLGLEHVPLVATVGLFNPYNRLDIALRAFRRLVDNCADAVYLMVGEPPDKQLLTDQISALGLDANVRLTGWVSTEDFEKYVRIPDVAIQLRYPHAGSTCYNPIRLAAWGVPTIISRIGPMQDIPEDVMVAIEPDSADEVDTVYGALHELLTDDQKRTSMGTRARAFITDNNTAQIGARRLTGFLEQIGSRQNELEERRSRRYCPRAAALGTQGVLVQQLGSALGGLGVTGTTTGWGNSLAESIVTLSEPRD